MRYILRIFESFAESSAEIVFTTVKWLRALCFIFVSCCVFRSSNSSLATLDLFANQIGDAGASSLAGALRYALTQCRLLLVSCLKIQYSVFCRTDVSEPEILSQISYFVKVSSIGNFSLVIESHHNFSHDCVSLNLILSM